MRVVSRLSGIVAASRGATVAMPRVAALALVAATLAGCGQRGPLYLPSVPPLPQPPAFMTQPGSDASAKSAPDSGEDAATRGELRSAPTLSSPASAPSAASSPR